MSLDNKINASEIKAAKIYATKDLMGGTYKPTDERFGLWFLIENMKNDNLITDIGNINYSEGCKKLENIIPLTDTFCDNITVFKIIDFEDCNTGVKQNIQWEDFKGQCLVKKEILSYWNIYLRTAFDKIKSNMNDIKGQPPFKFDIYAKKLNPTVESAIKIIGEDMIFVERKYKNPMLLKYKISLADIKIHTLLKTLPDILNLIKKEEIYLLDLDITKDYAGIFNKRKTIKKLLKRDDFILQKSNNIKFNELGGNDMTNKRLRLIKEKEYNSDIASNIILDNDKDVGIDCLSWMNRNTRVKIYNKFVCQLTSAGVNAQLGNNIYNFIDCPDERLKKTFKNAEALKHGITRLEITIYNYTSVYDEFNPKNIEKDESIPEISKIQTPFERMDNFVRFILEKSIIFYTEKICDEFILDDKSINDKIYKELKKRNPQPSLSTRSHINQINLNKKPKKDKKELAKVIFDDDDDFEVDDLKKPNNTKNNSVDDNINQIILNIKKNKKDKKDLAEINFDDDYFEVDDLKKPDNTENNLKDEIDHKQDMLENCEKLKNFLTQAILDDLYTEFKDYTDFKKELIRNKDEYEIEYDKLIGDIMNTAILYKDVIKTKIDVNIEEITTKIINSCEETYMQRNEIETEIKKNLKKNILQHMVEQLKKDIDNLGFDQISSLMYQIKNDIVKKERLRIYDLLGIENNPDKLDTQNNQDIQYLKKSEPFEPFENYLNKQHKTKTIVNPLNDCMKLLKENKKYLEYITLYSAPLKKMWQKISNTLKNSCCVVFKNRIQYVWWGNSITKKLTGFQIKINENKDEEKSNKLIEKYIKYILSMNSFNNLPVNLVKIEEDIEEENNIAIEHFCYEKEGDTYFTTSKNAYAKISKDIDIESTGLVKTNNIRPAVLRKNEKMPTYYPLKEILPPNKPSLKSAEKRREEEEKIQIEQYRNIFYTDTTVKEKVPLQVKEDANIKQKKEILDYFLIPWCSLELNKRYKVIAIEVSKRGKFPEVGILCEDEENIKKVYRLKGSLKKILARLPDDKNELKYYNIISYAKNFRQIYYHKFEPYIMILQTPNEMKKCNGHSYIEPIPVENYMYSYSDSRIKKLEESNVERNKIDNLKMEKLEGKFSKDDCVIMDMLIEESIYKITHISAKKQGNKINYTFKVEEDDTFYKSNYWFEKEIKDKNINLDYKILMATHFKTHTGKSKRAKELQVTLQ